MDIGRNDAGWQAIRIGWRKIITLAWAFSCSLTGATGRYLRTPVADFYSLSTHRLMIYALTFILMGLGVFGVLAIYDRSDALITISLKFMGITAWHRGATLTLATIIVDNLIALLVRPWGSFERRTVGKLWVIYFAAYLVGLFAERIFAYKLIGFYEPKLLYLWEVAPSQRAGALTVFLLSFPFWFFIVMLLMKIITRKQTETEALLRGRIETLLHGRSPLADLCPAPIPQSGNPKRTAPIAPLRLPLSPGNGPIFAAEIGHVTTEDHYLRIYYQKEGVLKDALVRLSLRKLLSQLPRERFVQIHRSHVINLEQISGLNRSGRSARVSMTHGEFELPVSRYRLPHLLPLLESFLSS